MADIKTYNPAFRKAYEFMEKHLNVDGFNDWEAVTRDIPAGASDFELGLISEVVKEIDRVYTARKSGV